MIRLYSENYLSKNDKFIDISNMCTLSKIKEINNGSYTLEQEYKYSEPLFKVLTKRKCIRVNTHSGHHSFRITGIHKSMTSIKVTGVTMFIADMEKSFLRKMISVSKGTCQKAMDEIKTHLDVPVNYTFKSNLTNTENIKLVEESVLDCFVGKADNSLINRYGGVIEFKEFEVAINTMRGNKTPRIVTYGTSISEADITEDSDTLVTRIFPKGFDGIKLPEASPYVDSPKIDFYSAPLVKKMYWEDVKIGEGGFANLEEAQKELVRKCEKEFENGIDVPKTNIRVKVGKLTNTEFEQMFGFAGNNSVDIGDIFEVRIPKFSIMETKEVISITYDTLKNEYIEVELGQFILDNTGSSSGTENTVVTGGGNESTFGVYFHSNANAMSLTNVFKEICRISYGASKPAHLLMAITINMDVTGTDKVYMELENNGEKLKILPQQTVYAGKEVLTVNLPLTYIEPDLAYNLVVKMKTDNQLVNIPSDHFQITVSGDGISGSGTEYPYANVEEHAQFSKITGFVSVDVVDAWTVNPTLTDITENASSMVTLAPVDFHTDNAIRLTTPRVTNAGINYPSNEDEIATAYFTIKELDDYYQHPTKSFNAVATFRAKDDKAWKHECDPILINKLMQDFEVPQMSDKFLGMETEIYVEIREVNTSNWTAQLHPFSIGIPVRPRDPLALYFNTVSLDYKKDIFGTIDFNITNVNAVDGQAVILRVELLDNIEVYQEWDITNLVDENLNIINSVTDVRSDFSNAYHRFIVKLVNSDNTIQFKDERRVLKFLPYEPMAVGGHCYSRIGNTSVEWKYRSIRNKANTSYKVYLNTPTDETDRDFYLFAISDELGTVEINEIVDLTKNGINVIGNQTRAFLGNTSTGEPISNLQVFDYGIVTPVRDVKPVFNVCEIELPAIPSMELGTLTLDISNLEPAYRLDIELECNNGYKKVWSIDNFADTVLVTTLSDIEYKAIGSKSKVRIIAVLETGNADYVSEYFDTGIISRPSGLFNFGMTELGGVLTVTTNNIESCDTFKIEVSDPTGIIAPIVVEDTNLIPTLERVDVINLGEHTSLITIEVTCIKGTDIIKKSTTLDISKEKYEITLSDTDISLFRELAITETIVKGTDNDRSYIIPILYNDSYTITKIGTSDKFKVALCHSVNYEEACLKTFDVSDTSITVKTDNPAYRYLIINFTGTSQSCNFTITSSSRPILTFKVPEYLYSNNPNEINTLDNISIVNGYKTDKDGNMIRWSDLGLRRDYNDNFAMDLKATGEKKLNILKANEFSCKYIRIWNTGNSVNTDNHFCEMQLLNSNGENILSSSTVSKYHPYELNIRESEPNALWDNDMNSYYDIGNTYKSIYGLTIDLGQVTSIHKVTWFNYLQDNRTYYDTVICTSDDGIIWVEKKYINRVSAKVEYDFTLSPPPPSDKYYPNGVFNNIHTFKSDKDYKNDPRYYKLVSNGGALSSSSRTYTLTTTEPDQYVLFQACNGHYGYAGDWFIDEQKFCSLGSNFNSGETEVSGTSYKYLTSRIIQIQNPGDHIVRVTGSYNYIDVWGVIKEEETEPEISLDKLICWVDGREVKGTTLNNKVNNTFLADVNTFEDTSFRFKDHIYVDLPNFTGDFTLETLFIPETTENGADRGLCKIGESTMNKVIGKYYNKSTNKLLNSFWSPNNYSHHFSNWSYMNQYTLVCKSGTLYSYMNGKLICSTSNPSTISTHRVELLPYSNMFSNRVYTRALSEKEVLNNYKYELTTRTTEEPILSKLVSHIDGRQSPKDKYFENLVNPTQNLQILGEVNKCKKIGGKYLINGASMINTLNSNLSNCCIEITYEYLTKHTTHMKDAAVLGSRSDSSTNSDFVISPTEIWSRQYGYIPFNQDLSTGINTFTMNMKSGDTCDIHINGKLAISNGKFPSSICTSAPLYIGGYWLLNNEVSLDWCNLKMHSFRLYEGNLTEAQVFTNYLYEIGVDRNPIELPPPTQPILEDLLIHIDGSQPIVDGIVRDKISNIAFTGSNILCKNNYYEFDGSSSTLVSDNLELNNYEYTVCISAMCNILDTNPKALFTHRGGGLGPMIFGMNNVIHVDTKDHHSRVQTNLKTSDLSEYVNLTITVNSKTNELIVYKDDKLHSTYSFSIDGSTNTAPVSLFSDTGLELFVKANLGSFKYYTRALTAEEIIHNYKYEESIDREPSTTPEIIQDGLICHLDGRDGSNSEQTLLWKDRSGNGNDIQLSELSFTEYSGWDRNKLILDGKKDFGLGVKNFDEVIGTVIFNRRTFLKYTQTKTIGTLNIPPVDETRGDYGALFDYTSGQSSSSWAVYSSAGIGVSWNDSNLIQSKTDNILATVNESNKCVIYSNGTKLGDKSVEIVPYVGGALQLGKFRDVNCYLEVSDILIYNRALSDLEINKVTKYLQNKEYYENVVDTTLGIPLKSSNKYVMYGASDYNIVQSTDRDLIEYRNTIESIYADEILAKWRSRSASKETELIPIKQVLDLVVGSFTDNETYYQIDGKLSFFARGNGVLRMKWELGVNVPVNAKVFIDDIEVSIIDFVATISHDIKFEDGNWHKVEILSENNSLQISSLVFENGVMQVSPLNNSITTL